MLDTNIIMELQAQDNKKFKRLVLIFTVFLTTISFVFLRQFFPLGGHGYDIISHGLSLIIIVLVLAIIWWASHVIIGKSKTSKGATVRFVVILIIMLLLGFGLDAIHRL